MECLQRSSVKACAGANEDGRDDTRSEHSAVSTSVQSSSAKSNQRRALRRKARANQVDENYVLHEHAPDAASTSAERNFAKMFSSPSTSSWADKEIQCELLIKSDSKEEVSRLRRKLQETRLNHLKLKGKYSSLRRMMCGESHSDSVFSDVSDSGHSSANCCSEYGDPDEFEQHGHSSQHDSVSDLPDNIEVGDVVEIVGLTSDKGQKLNGYYAKVETWCESTHRFGVNFRGKLLALKPENLSMGMKSEEMSASDEDMLLGLEPAAPEVLALPWKERGQRMGLIRERCEPQMAPSSQ